MIYMLVNVVFAPGKMAEGQEIWIKEAMPVLSKLGFKLVGAWHGYTGNVNETYTLVAYNNLAEMQKAWEATAQNKDYQRVQAKMDALRVSYTTTILKPNAWSPMQ